MENIVIENLVIGVLNILFAVLIMRHLSREAGRDLLENMRKDRLTDEDIKDILGDKQFNYLNKL